MIPQLLTHLLRPFTLLLVTLAALFVPAVAPAQNTHRAELIRSSAQYLTAADSPSLSITGDMTIEAWVKDQTPFSASEYRTILAKLELTGSGNFRSYSFKRSKDSGGTKRLAVALASSGSPGVEFELPFAFNDLGSWTHYAMAYTAASGRVDLFVNGVNVGNLTGFPTSIADSNVPVKIGATYSGEETHDGSLDEVRLWSVARTEQQIRASMFRELPATDLNLRGYWKLNGSLVDHSGNGNALNSSASPPTLKTSDLPFAGDQLEWCVDKDTTSLFHLSNAADASSSGLTLANNNSVTFAPGLFALAADFGASNTNKTLVSSSNGSIHGGNITLSAWIKPASLPSSNADPFAQSTFNAVGVENGSLSVAYNIHLSNVSGSQRIYFSRWRQGITTTGAYFEASAPLTEWTHVAGTYEASSGQLRIYVNGIEGIGNSQIGNGSAGLDQITIGGRRGGVGYYPGMVDEVLISSRVLTTGEVMKYYGGIVTARFSPVLDGGLRSDRPALATWSDLRQSATSVSTTAPLEYLSRLLRTNSTATGWRDLHRGVIHFGSSSLPDNGIAINHAEIGLRIPSKGSIAPSSLVVVRSNIASDTSLTETDFNLYGQTELTPRASFSSIQTGTRNSIPLNAAGLGNLNPSGASKFFFLVDRDFDNSEPPELVDRYLDFDTSESTNEKPDLKVEYTALDTSSISGTVSGINLPSGTIRLVASSTTTATSRSDELTAPGPYSLAGLASGQSYIVSAFVDGNANGFRDPLEWFGNHPGNPLLLNGDNTNIDITITAPEDSDNDGMPDAWEATNGLTVGLDDANLDRDSDGLMNIQELWLGLPANDPDFDNDGLSDGVEVNQKGSDALLTDTDGDGLPDKWEADNGLDPRRNDADEDHDHDFISNRDEYNGGTTPTNPSSSDSDGNGLSDYSQRNGGANTWQALYDRNNRLLGVRHARGSSFVQRYDGNGNPVRQVKLGLDSDGDGLSDLWEFAHGLDPKSGAGNDGSSGDGDGDGWSNLQEQAGGSSPTLAAWKPGANGSVVGNFNVPFTPTNFVSTSGQIDFGGSEEFVVAADGNPGGAENVIRVYREAGAGWEFEPVTIGTYGVTSLAIGQLGSRSPAIYLGLRKTGGLGRVIELRKAGATWQTTVIAESLGESAVVHGVRGSGTEADLVLGLASRFGPAGALYRATVETDSWKVGMLEAGASNRGPGMIVKSASSGVADRVLRLQDIGGIQIAEAKNHTSLDEFNAEASRPFSPAIWMTTNQATEFGGLGRVEVFWTSGQGATVSSSAEAPLQWPSTASGLEFRLALGEHSQPTSSNFGGGSTIHIGTTQIYGSGQNRGDSNVDLQVLRKDSLLFFRQRSNGAAWGAWASGPTGSYVRMEVSGRDVGSSSSFGSARLHMDYIRYRTPSQLLSAGSTLVDFTSSEAVYRSSTNKWYFKTSALPWMSAQLQAFAQGGKLATIDSSDLNSWLPDKFPGETWLGYYRNASSSPWTWLSGSISSYTSWAAGQPGTSADQVYAFSNAGTWSSATGGELKSGITEIMAHSQEVATTVVNEPAASTRLQWLSQTLANGRFNPSVATQTSAVESFIDDKDTSNTVTAGDDFVLAEWVIDASPPQIRTLERRELADGTLPSSYGLAAARTKEGTSDLLVTAENDGKVFAWLPPAGGGALVRNLISVDHVGKAWHGLSRVSMGGGTDGIAGLRVTPGSPQTVDIVFWSPTELGFSAPPVIIQSPPSARIAATPASGGASAPVNVTLWDSEGNPSRVAVQYQNPPGSGPWQDATLLTIAGQPAATQPSLGAPPTGQTHPITWNALTDLGSAFDSAVLLRARATDMSGTGPWSEPMFYSVDLTNDTDGDGIPNDWELANGLNPEVQDSELDLDKDGLQNLIEFAIGSNPQSPANTNVPIVFFGNSVGAPAAPGDTRYLTMTVTKNPAAAALNFSVEISSNLTTWQSGAETLTILEESATQLKVRDNSAVPSNPRRAMRLKVTSP